MLPPTPPSSSNSDSDSCPSPQRSAPSSPVRQHPYSRQHHSSSSLSPCSLSPTGSSKYYNQPIISNQVITLNASQGQWVHPINNFERKSLIIFLFIGLNMCFGCSKEPSHWDGSFEYPQHIFCLQNNKNKIWLQYIATFLWLDWYSVHFFFI